MILHRRACEAELMLRLQLADNLRVLRLRVLDVEAARLLAEPLQNFFVLGTAIEQRDAACAARAPRHSNGALVDSLASSRELPQRQRGRLLRYELGAETVAPPGAQALLTKRRATDRLRRTSEIDPTRPTEGPSPTPRPREYTGGDARIAKISFV